MKKITVLLPLAPDEMALLCCTFTTEQPSMVAICCLLIERAFINENKLFWLVVSNFKKVIPLFEVITLNCYFCLLLEYQYVSL